MTVTTRSFQRTINQYFNIDNNSFRTVNENPISGNFIAVIYILILLVRHIGFQLCYVTECHTNATQKNQDG